MPGRVIFLNGSSSAGKTTLSWALREVLPDTWLALGIDTFIYSAPFRLFGTEEGHRFVDGPRLVSGPEFLRLNRAWHRAAVTLLEEGFDLIVDEVLFDAAIRDDWLQVLAPYDVLWIKVWCEPETCEERASRRGDRMPGMARLQAAEVHDGVPYSLEVDTTATDTGTLARTIAAAVAAR
ncbi:MAG TPA: AAA family ATPase [Acidimicrobiales bacterium]|nr:AAA family ATPase [Acidimicrobiales bacterium]